MWDRIKDTLVIMLLCCGIIGILCVAYVESTKPYIQATKLATEYIKEDTRVQVIVEGVDRHIGRGYSSDKYLINDGQYRFLIDAGAFELPAGTYNKWLDSSYLELKVGELIHLDRRVYRDAEGKVQYVEYKLISMPQYSTEKTLENWRN